jgi:photosystem II stability/assembly factor-like uncharacterized protein
MFHNRTFKVLSSLILLVFFCTRQVAAAAPNDGARFQMRSTTAADVWANTGPEGGVIDTLAIDPTTPTTLYAGVGWNNGGAFKSTDGGVTWSAVNTGLANTSVFDLAINPITPTTLYAGTGGGVFKSTNGGGNWSAASTGLTYGVWTMVIDPATPSTLYVGTEGGGVLKSTNSGGNWSAVNTGLTNPTVSILAIDPMTPSTLYAGTFWGSGGVFKSTNGGGTWSVVNANLTNINALAIDPVTPTTLYAGTDGGGVFKSTDGGGTWITVSTGLTNTRVWSLTIDPAMPSTLYAGVGWEGGGVFKSTNGGGNWSAVDTGLPNTSVGALAIDPATPSTLYAGTTVGVFKSMNGSGYWSAVNTGIAAHYVHAVAIDPATPTTVYTGMEGGGVLKSTNAGGNWSAVNVGLSRTWVNVLAIDPATPATLYAGTDGGDGIFKSMDGGGSWSAVNAGLTNTYVRSLAIDPATPTTLYAGTDGGMFKSVNGGGNWSSVNAGLTNTSINTMTVDPITPATLYAGTDGGVFKSANGGGNWIAVNTGLTNLAVLALAVDPASPSTLYAGTYGGGVFKSADSGGNWNVINTGLTDPHVLSLGIDAIHSTTLYAGTLGGGVFKSVNGGGNWNAMNTGLTNYHIQSLAIDPTTPTTLYAGTRGDSAFVIHQTPPNGPPMNLVANTGVSSIVLDWDPSLSNNVVGYRVYRSASATSNFTKIADAVSTTNYVDTAGLTIGATYYYYVTAYNASGEESAPSNIARAVFGQLKLWIPHLHGTTGTTATVPINISNADGLKICAMDIAVNFAPSIITAQSIERTALTAGYGFSANTSAPGTVRVSVASGIGTPLYGSGTLFNLVVNVPGSSGSSTPLQFEVVLTDVYNCGNLYQPVDLTLTNGSFTVGDLYVKGDINGDGKVNSADAALALQIASGLVTPTSTQLAAGDVNGDSKINSADASLILYYAANGQWPPAPSAASIADAAQATSATLLSLPITQGQPDGIVQVDLSASGVSGMAGADLALSYDANVLDVVGVNLGTLTSGFTLQTNTATPGLVRFSLSNSTGIASDAGTLATIQFKVKSTAVNGSSSPLTLTQARMNDGNGLDFGTSALQRQVQKQNGQVTVGSVTPPLTKTFYSSSKQDGWVLEFAEPTNIGGTLNSAASNLLLGDDATNSQYRAILSFSTSLPGNAVISKVTLMVKGNGVKGGGNPVKTFKGFMADVKKGFFDATSALELADFQAEAGHEALGPLVVAPSSSGWYSLNLTGAKKYIGSLTQIRLRFKLDDNNNHVANYLMLYSGEMVKTSRPRLVIEYYIP